MPSTLRPLWVMGRIRGAGSNTYLEYNEEGEPLKWIMEYANFDDS